MDAKLRRLAALYEAVVSLELSVEAATEPGENVLRMSRTAAQIRRMIVQEFGFDLDELMIDARTVEDEALASVDARIAAEEAAMATARCAIVEADRLLSDNECGLVLTERFVSEIRQS